MEPKALYDVIVVGGGPAGMTAAMYARRAGKQVLVIEAKAFGGQILTSGEIENYPGIPHVSGAEFAQAMEAQITGLGAHKKYARVTGLRREGDNFYVLTDGEGDFYARKVILATGVEHRKLGIPGEERLCGRGISWCATCDGNFFRGMDVAVAGGGNTAVQEAIHLAAICRKVWLIHRREELRAETWLVERMKATQNIEFLPETVVREAVGNERLEGLILEHTKTKKQTRLEVRGLFEAVGMIPQNRNFADLLALDENGYFRAEENCETAVSGIFVAGDCRSKTVRQLVSAASDGAAAAMGAVRALSE